MDDRDIETIVFTALGEASTCWRPSTGDAEFDAARAQAIGDQLLTEIRSRIVGDRTDELIAKVDWWRSALEREQERSVLANTAADAAAEAVGTMAERLTVTMAEHDRLWRIVAECYAATFLATQPSCDNLDAAEQAAVPAMVHATIRANFRRAEEAVAEQDRLRATIRDALAEAGAARDAVNEPGDCFADVIERQLGPEAAELNSDRAQTATEAERDRLRAALILIAIPPSNAMRDDHEFTACTGCAHVAQRALDGHDYRPNVAQLDAADDKEVTDD